MTEPTKADYRGLLTRSHLLTPELALLWKSMKPIPHRPHSESHPAIGDGHPVQVLYFNTHEAAANWAFMAYNNTSPGDFLGVYASQTGKPLDSAFLHEPHILKTRFSKEYLRHYTDDKNFMTIYRGIDFGRGDFDEYARERLLNQHEEFNAWCWLCRGNGFIIALKKDEPLQNEAGIPTPFFQLSCIHNYFRINDKINVARSGKKKTLISNPGAMPF